MEHRADFPSLLDRCFASQPKPPSKSIANTKEHLAQEHEEIMRLLKNEESLSKELTKKTL